MILKRTPASVAVLVAYSDLPGRVIGVRDHFPDIGKPSLVSVGFLRYAAAQPSLILFRQLLDEAAEKGLAE